MQYMSLYQSFWLLYEGLMELMESVKIAAFIVLDLKNGKASCMWRVTVFYFIIWFQCVKSRVKSEMSCLCVCVLNLYMYGGLEAQGFGVNWFYWGLGKVSCPALSSLVFCSASCSSMNSSAPEGWKCLWRYDCSFFLVRVGLTHSSSVANSPPDLSYPKAFYILSPPHIHPALTATNHYCAHHAHNSILLFLDFTRVALLDSQLKIILSNADLWCSPSVDAPKRLKLLDSNHPFFFV